MHATKRVQSPNPNKSQKISRKFFYFQKKTLKNRNFWHDLKEYNLNTLYQIYKEQLLAISNKSDFQFGKVLNPLLASFKTLTTTFTINKISTDVIADVVSFSDMISKPVQIVQFQLTRTALI